MLKVGVLGAGHLGKIHLRLLNQSEKYELVGFYDAFEENANKVAAEFGYKKFDSIAELISAVDVVDIYFTLRQTYGVLSQTSGSLNDYSGMFPECFRKFGILFPK